MRRILSKPDSDRRATPEVLSVPIGAEDRMLLVGSAAVTATSGVTATRKKAGAAGTRTAASETDIRWLELDAVADVTIVAGGRRAARVDRRWSTDSAGEQTIEIRFRQPTRVRRLRVVSSELQQRRTQEMTIWASLHRGERHHEVLRQQFTFSPNGATQHAEEYAVQLDDVSIIQLRIVPSVDGRPAVACVSEFRVGSVQTETRT
jgi:hypothetical protein